MLVLTRKPQEKVCIGDNITITIVRVKGKSVRIGIEAPGDVHIVRAELDDFHLAPQASESPADRSPAPAETVEPAVAAAKPAGLHGRVQLARRRQNVAEALAADERQSPQTPVSVDHKATAAPMETGAARDSVMGERSGACGLRRPSTLRSGVRSLLKR